jgi:CheY-like chemotaxis protein/DNA-binding XRE family transcriptional regulator
LVKKHTSINLRFGQAVRRFRHALDLSQETLAERAGLDRTYIGHVERGARNVSLATIAKLARALDVSAARLLLGPSDVAAGSGAPRLKGIAECLDPHCAGKNCVDILMVEGDSDAERQTLRAFKQAGIVNPVKVVRNGTEALTLLLNAPIPDKDPPPIPHLILLELDLPGMDGLEVLRRLKAHPRTRPIPVVVVTSPGHAGKLEECRRLGAADYLTKPIHFQSLGRVTAQLHLRWALLRSTNGNSENSRAVGGR